MTVEFTGEVHSAAAKAPMRSEAELREMAESIAEVGLIHPIVLNPEGKLLGGRNRLAACKIAGVEPSFEVYEGDEIGFILAEENRRHMSPGANAMWRAQVMADAGMRSNGRWQRGSVETQDLGKAHGEAMRQAGLVIDHAPDLAPDVISEEMALDAAHREAKRRRDAAKALAEMDADLVALVQAETITLDEAVARQDLPPEFRQRVNDGHITVEEAQKLSVEQDERMRSVHEAIRQWVTAHDRLEAARHSPEYPAAITTLEDPDLAKRISKEFPHVK